MKKSILRMRKILLPTLLALGLSMVIVLGGTTSPTSAITQMNPKTTVYLDPPTINGTAIAEEFTVDINIRDSPNMTRWKASITFNATLLECIGFDEGGFLSSAGTILWGRPTIDNALGVITGRCTLLYGAKASGSGRLAYATFRVKALGLSDLHLHDVQASDVIDTTEIMIPINIIDVYTVIVNATAHTVVTVSNSTGKTAEYGSGFYDHAFIPGEEISFNVTGPYPGYSNVTIPKTLLNVSILDQWTVIIDGRLLSTEERTVTYSGTHYSIYSTYSKGIHTVQITTRMSSTISIALSSISITLGSNVTISGNITADDPINPLRPNVNVTIRSRPIGAITWDTIDTVKTDSNSSYTYTWTPETGGTHEVRTRWEGDEETIDRNSDVWALTVLYFFEPEGVYIETNSTVAEFNSISAFNFSQPLKQISFNVTSPYGTFGYSNVTIPKTLLLPPEPPREWAVVIDGTLLSAEEIIVTENATHTFIYFTYSKGNHTVQITIRMTSTITISLSSTSIILGSNITISGNITAEDHTGRPNITVTIQSRPVGAPDWHTVDTVKTYSNSSYTYTWTPETGGTHEVRTRWNGDSKTLGDESDVWALTVLYFFEPEGVYIETNSTVAEFNSISAFNFSQPLKQISFNVTGPYPGFSNVTIPKALLNVSTLEEWKVIIDGRLLSTEERNVTENTHTSIYFTYEKGNHAVQITTRILYNSTVSIALSSTTITLGSSVTISGNITTDDPVDPVRANVTVTIDNRTEGAVDWGTLVIVTTDQNGSYTYDWTPEKAGVYEVMASWEGDNITTFGNESVVLTLRVIQSSTISIAISEESISLGESVTISGAIDPVRPNVTVTIHNRTEGDEEWDTLATVKTDQNSEYTYTWEPGKTGTYEVKAEWLGYPYPNPFILGAESDVLTLTVLKMPSTISITLSSTNITLGSNITISGEIDPVRSDVDVTIRYTLNAGDWTTLANVTTDPNSRYNYIWAPEAAGTYEIKASWEGDDITLGNETDPKTLTIQEAPGIPLTVVVAAVVAIIIIAAAIVVYFVRFRKPR